MSTATATVKIVKEQPDEDGYYECGYDMHTAGYLVYIDGEFVGAVYRDPTVAAGYWSAWKGAGVGSTRKAAVAEVVARWNAKK